MNYLQGLNENQLRAVTHMEGPCLVIAGAGSGKTRVLTTRIAHLIDQGIKSSNILAITFTNKAAGEMKERVNNLVYDNFSFVGTFHSFGVKIIRENYELLNLEKNFTILDSDDTLSVIKKIMKDIGADPKELAPMYVKNKISFIKNEMLTASEIEKFFNTPNDKLVKDIYYRYIKILEKNNSLDFDDLLDKPLKLFLDNRDILEKYQEKYQYILVDEYQDTNKLQYELIKELSNKYRNVFVVGDINQSIYAFRGANYKNILNFEKDFKDTLVITLEQNYRSTTNILNAANDVIKNNEDLQKLNLYSNLGQGVKIIYRRNYNDFGEVSNVAHEIKKLLERGYKKKDIAIFYRANAQSRLIEEEMMKHSIPYKIVGNFFFYKRKEIKDLISYLKLLSNPKDDVSLERIINVPKRGIGDVTVNKLRDQAYLENKSILEIITGGKELEFKKIIDELLVLKDELSLTELIDKVLEKTNMLNELEKEKTLEADLRIENLMEFKSITESFQDETGTVNLDDFLENISLVADITEYEDESDVVTLMTVHASKGLEFKVVFVIGLEEGLFPHAFAASGLEPEEMAEERRLCYVAITRAKERLYLSNAQRRMLFGRPNENLPSRFLDEISDEYLEKISDVKDVITEPKINKDLFYTEEVKEYKIGDRVIHAVFGQGIVVEVKEKTINIKFNKVGIKTVLINYKGLEKF